MSKRSFPKKIFVLLVLSFLFIHLSFAQEAATVRDNSYLGIGLGLGIPYGVLGANVEVTPIDYFSISGGIGYAPGGVGYSVGARIYPLGRSKDFFPRIGAYYGIVGAIEYWWTGWDPFDGFAVGAGGVWWKKGKKFSLDGEVIFIFASELASSPTIRVSFGFKWHIFK